MDNMKKKEIEVYKQSIKTFNEFWLQMIEFNPALNENIWIYIAYSHLWNAAFKEGCIFAEENEDENILEKFGMN